MEKRYDVFISYSTQDQKVVEGVCGFLEREGYRCFVAYRDIPRGVVWASAITEGLDASKMMVVVFSNAFNMSKQTDREIEIASENAMPILTYRVADATMTGAKKYYLKNLNWIDAFPNPEDYFGRLLDSVVKLIGPSKNAVDNAAKEETERLAKMESERLAREAAERERLEQERKAEDAKRKAEQERRERERAEAQRMVEAESSGNTKGNPKSKTGLWIALGAVAVVALVLLFVLPKKHQNTYSDPPETPPVQVAVPMSDLTITANGVSFAMKPVEGGTFQMGSNDSEAYDWEKPVHSVTVSSFYMAETEVTQALWKAVMGTEPTYNGGWETQYGRGNNYPAYRVSWNDCQEFIRKLNSLTGKNFRLPTEAEWEYAARGGNKSNGCKYAGSNSIGSVAWYDDNSGSSTHEVRTKSPNELGLYDMSGNVWEWCQDWYGNYSSGSQTNPQGPSSGSGRVLRGGGWDGIAATCRVTNRDSSAPDRRIISNGFRVVLVP